MVTASEQKAAIRTNIPSRLDRLPWSPWHLRVVLALGVTWILDGLEVTIVGSLGAVLTHPDALGLTEDQVGLSASVYLAGTVLGAIIFSHLTDLQGRKKWFLWTLALYLVSTLLTSISWNFESFLFFRFLTGAGIGGEYAAINSAIDELIPARVRGHTDIAINGSWWVGTAIGALLTVWLLDPDLFSVGVGWRLCFAIGAVLGIAIVLVRRFVPESPRWLILHGRVDEAERIVGEIEGGSEAAHQAGEDVPPPTWLTIVPRSHVTLREVAHQLFRVYPKRSVLGLTLMVTQSFLYNAIFFTYALVLAKYYDVPADEVGLYIVPFAVSNFLGPLLLGRLFDTVGRRVMITTTYGVSGILLAVTGWLFLDDRLDATTQTLCWSAVFFFASAGASSAYLTVSEVFPMEIRARAIAFFFIIAQSAGVAAPWIFGMLVGSSRFDVFVGDLVGAGLMLVGAVVAMILAVDAQGKSLEDLAAPLSARP